MNLGMKHIDSLSITEKISLYNCLYKDLAGKGIDGDTELAHVNKEEMEVLRSMGGSGTINPHTNLIQFGGGGRSSQPAQTTTVQQSEFPTELKPFIKDIFGKAQAIQEKREREGYTPFQGPRVADFTQDQLTAFQGVRDTVGAGDPFFTRSEELFESSTAEPTARSVGRFMNPYIQNVLDIERREARRDAETVGQNIAGRAARAGGFGGSREAILAAENERNTQRNLADIQSRGLASAFEDAQSRLAQQRGREMAAGQQFANLGTTVPAQRLRELQALEATGSAQQQQTQQGLDIAQQEFEFGRTFPERTLQDYSSILRGFTKPLPATSFKTENTFAPRASFGQQAATGIGLGLRAADVAGRFNFKGGGLVGLSNGGKTVGDNYSLRGRSAEELRRRLQGTPRNRAGAGETIIEEQDVIIDKSSPNPIQHMFPRPPENRPVATPLLKERGRQTSSSSFSPPDQYGLADYIKALKRSEEAKREALQTTDEEKRNKLLRTIADSALTYGGAATVDAKGRPKNELQKLQEGFGGLGGKLEELDTAAKAAKIAEGDLDRETQEKLFDIKTKLASLKIKAAKLGVDAKELVSLVQLVQLSPDRAKTLVNSKDISKGSREVLKLLLADPLDTENLESDSNSNQKPLNKRGSLITGDPI